MAFESLTERLNGVFKKLRGKGKLNEADIKAAMREVRMALLEADVNYKVAKDFCAQVSERAMGQEVMESLTPAQQVVKIVNEELTNLMGGNEPKYLRLKNKGQTVLMMCGLQGNGKTTHAAKLGKYYRSQGRRPLLVACDIYRPAAIEQLKVVGEQAGVPVFTLGTEKPEIIAQKALAYAKDHGNDIVILDTAGRLQIDDQLMDELVRIKQAVEVDERQQPYRAVTALEADDGFHAGIVDHRLQVGGALGIGACEIGLLAVGGMRPELNLQAPRFEALAHLRRVGLFRQFPRRGDDAHRVAGPQVGRADELRPGGWLYGVGVQCRGCLRAGCVWGAGCCMVGLQRGRCPLCRIGG